MSPEEYDELASKEMYLMLRAENREAVCELLGIPADLVGAFTLDGEAM